MFSRPISSLSIPPSTKSTLQRAGFETVADLGSITAEQLSKELSLPSFVCEDILNNARSIVPVLSRSVTAMLDAVPIKYSICEAIDEILGGDGLKKGSVLELSGPPGCPKERAVYNLVRSVVRREEKVIFVDTQNAMLRSTLIQELEDLPRAADLVRYVKCHSFSQLFVFIHNLAALIERESNISLVVLNSLSFLIHATPLPHASRVSVLDQLKGTLAKLCTTKQLTVVTTVQMATKLFSANGTRANFDTGTKAVLVPQLGDSYLPAGRSYRLTFALSSPDTGIIRLLLSPSTSASKTETNAIQKSYVVIEGEVRLS